MDNRDKAKIFRETFFPRMADAKDEIVQAPVEELEWELITELEIYRSLKAAKGTTAPGEDGIPTLVWKHLWRHLHAHITRFFSRSVDLGYYLI
jgi:hypothetical protein